jgi:hypothetical protein
MVDLIVLAVLLLGGYVGWRRGTLAMALAVLSLAAAYAGALLLSRPLGGAMSRFLDAPPLIALPVGGVLGLLLTTLVARFATRSIDRRKRPRRRRYTQAAMERRQLEDRREPRAGGAVLGAVWAAGIVVIAAWAVTTFAGVTGRGPTLENTYTGRLASTVMHRAAFMVTRSATGDPFLGSVLASLAARPRQTLDAAAALASHQRARALWADPTLREALARGDSAALSIHPTVRELAADSQFRSAAAELGLADPPAKGAAWSGRSLAASLVQRAGRFARTVQALRDDADMRRVLESPSLRSRLERGDLISLTTDPQFNRLVARMLEGGGQGR